MKKWRDKQVQKASRRVQGADGAGAARAAGQPLFRQKEFNAVEQEQDGPLVRADVMLVNGQTVRACDVLEPSWGRIEDWRGPPSPANTPSGCSWRSASGSGRRSTSSWSGTR